MLFRSIVYNILSKFPGQKKVIFFEEDTKSYFIDNTLRTDAPGEAIAECSKYLKTEGSVIIK